MAKKTKIKHVQLEPACYPADAEWGVMTPADRGIYDSLIMYMYCGDGTLFNGVSELARLCNCSDDVFEVFWKRYGRKFIEKNGRISHKRVTAEMTKARKYINQKSLAGKKGMQRRYNSVVTPLQQKDNEAITNKTKTKEKELVLELNKLALIFDDKIDRLIGPLLPNEKVTFRKIRMFLISFRNIKKMKKAIQWIGECSQWGSDHNKNSVEVKKCFVSKINKAFPNWKKR